MNNELLLYTRAEVPFPAAQVNIHNPDIIEIARIGEAKFFAACQIINFGKNQLSDEDKLGLEDKSDFYIFMSIMNEKSMAEHKNNVLLLFTLLFPDKQVKIAEDEIILIGSEGMARINELNFEEFKSILNSMFDFDSEGSESGGYNPADSRAKKIAEKLKKRKEKLNQGKPQDKIAVFSRYISILTVGERKDMNSFSNYTVFQLKDEFKRFQMQQSYDFYKEAKMAGAKDLEEVDNWMEDIHKN